VPAQKDEAMFATPALVLGLVQADVTNCAVRRQVTKRRVAFSNGVVSTRLHSPLPLRALNFFGLAPVQRNMARVNDD
jgi:hypothetical protein